MAMLQCLRGLDAALTVHGFRSRFKDWASEATHVDNMISEAALAHVVADKVEAAYRRGDLLAEAPQADGRLGRLLRVAAARRRGGAARPQGVSRW